MSTNRNKWNTLYGNSKNPNRNPKEVHSVPTIEEWEADIFEYNYIYPYISPNDCSILDIGTGNGAILGVLLKHYPHLIGTGFDISDKAIELAKQMADKYELQDRMILLQKDMHDELDFCETYDIIMANYTLQFNDSSTLDSLVLQIKKLLKKSGRFIGVVRSTTRDVPETYKIYNGEQNTYVSYEEHERGMIYRHFSKEDIENIAQKLEGKIIWLNERHLLREYDPYPVRAWWEFVIQI